MIFNFGEALSRALQISWKHKTFWLLMMLPVLSAFVIFPFMFAFTFLLDGDSAEAIGVVLAVIMLILMILIFIVSLLLGVIATSSTTLGIVRVERGEGSLKFTELVRAALPYFTQSLGVLLIVQLSVGVFFTVFFMLVFVLSIVTMGLATICLQPVIFLLSPLMLLMIAVMEGAQTAIFTENLGALDAIKRGLQVVREHVWKYVVITLIIYFGTTIFISLIIFPVMLPMFIIPFLIESGAEMNNQMITIILTAFMCFFFPVMAVFSGITQTFMKASLAITYLRLTQKTENQV